jgi:hypothetical protein
MIQKYILLFVMFIYIIGCNGESSSNIEKTNLTNDNVPSPIIGNTLKSKEFPPTPPQI